VNQQHGWAACLAGLVLASLLVACGSKSSGAGARPALSSADAVAAVQNDFVAVVNKVRPSVVEVTTPAGLGSGIVYDSNGDIVTNDHVVGAATTFQVTFYDGQVLTGTLVGAFPPTTWP
jgi:S1-C subfamily serine protease